MQLTTVTTRNFAPDRFRTTLKFNAFGVKLNSGQAYMNIRYMPTNCYDIDPTLGSTAMPGFSELAGLYRRYRAIRFRAEVSFANAEAHTGVVWICPVNADPGANTTNYQYYLSNKRGKSVAIGPWGGNGVARLKTGWVGVAEFGGSKNPENDDRYSGDTNGSNAPQNIIWLAIGFLSDAAMTVGIQINLNLEVELEFFELTSPAS